MSDGSKSSVEIFGSVVWDYDPEDDSVSALASAERYFRNFPWEPIEPAAGGGDGRGDDPPPEPAETS